MAGFTGSALVVAWDYSGAVYTLTGDHRSFSYTPSIDLVDQTAGADANKTYLTTIKDGRISFGAVLQSGTSTGGTVLTAQLVEGYSGTLRVMWQGSAATKPVATIPAICMGVVQQYPYAGVVEYTVEFQQNGARTEGTL